MSDNDQLDVLIAVYLIPDLAQQDFDAFVKLAEDGDDHHRRRRARHQGRRGRGQVQETGDHLGRKGAKVGGGVGLVVGLFAPPLLAATAVGAAAGGLLGKFARKRAAGGDRREDGRRAAARLGGDHRDLRARRTPMPSPARSGTRSARSIAQIDKASAKELKAGLEEASAGLAGLRS